MARAQEMLNQRSLSNNSIRQASHLESNANNPFFEFQSLTFYLGQKNASEILKGIFSIVASHYKVKVLFSEAPNIEKNSTEQTAVLLGRKEHLLIAEHVLDFLTDQLDRLWKQTKKAMSMPANHKVSYQMGVLSGFQKKLNEQSTAFEAHSSNDSDSRSLIALEEDALMTIKLSFFQT